ncbi:MAG: hypothetical protein WC133_06515 [Candidatus Omnitrophota bacterium]
MSCPNGDSSGNFQRRVHWRAWNEGKTGNFEVVEITPDTVLLKDLKDGTSHIARL